MNIKAIDLRKCNSCMEVHKAIQEGLGLPTWYGNNVDALWDMVTGYIELPITICIFLPESSTKELVQEVHKIIKVFNRAIEQEYEIKLLNGLDEELIITGGES